MIIVDQIERVWPLRAGDSGDRGREDRRAWGARVLACPRNPVRLAQAPRSPGGRYPRYPTDRGAGRPCRCPRPSSWRSSAGSLGRSRSPWVLYGWRPGAWPYRETGHLSDQFSEGRLETPQPLGEGPPVRHGLQEVVDPLDRGVGVVHAPAGGDQLRGPSWRNGEILGGSAFSASSQDGSLSSGFAHNVLMRLCLLR